MIAYIGDQGFHGVSSFLGLYFKRDPKYSFLGGFRTILKCNIFGQGLQCLLQSCYYFRSKHHCGQIQRGTFGGNDGKSYRIVSLSKRGVERGRKKRIDLRKRRFYNKGRNCTGGDRLVLRRGGGDFQKIGGRSGEYAF